LEKQKANFFFFSPVIFGKLNSVRARELAHRATQVIES